MESMMKRYYEISIHAPRGGSDRAARFLLPRDRVISIHAPRGGSDCWTRRMYLRYCTFQSTLPAGGATPFSYPFFRERWYFNPRSPRGERPLTASDSFS